MIYNTEIILRAGTQMIGKTLNNEYYCGASYYDLSTGKRIRKHQTGFNKKETKLVEHNFLAEVTSTLSPKLTLKDVVYDYLQHRIPYIEQTTHFNNKRILDTYIYPHF